MFLVQEFSAGKWWNVKSFPTRPEAEAFAAKLGHKTRIKQI